MEVSVSTINKTKNEEEAKNREKLFNIISPLLNYYEYI